KAGPTQILLVGSAWVFAAVLLAEVRLLVGIPADIPDSSPDPHAPILIPVGALGPPDAPHCITSQDQDDDERERVETDRPPSRPEEGREGDDEQQSAGVEHPVRAL